MLFIIPNKSKLEEEYTLAQCNKIIFNHEAYLGEMRAAWLFSVYQISTKQ
jgi:hypothetical protein